MSDNIGATNQHNGWLAAVLDEPSSWAEISEEILAEQAERAKVRRAAGLFEPADWVVRCRLCGGLFRYGKSQDGRTTIFCGCDKAFFDPAMPVSKFTECEAQDFMVWTGEMYGWPSDVRAEVTR